tara:strand:- start:805 stop:1899 length:1095 start_codon:yes stop_codon:yes gene_type:complete
MSLIVIKIGTSIIRGSNTLGTRKVISGICSFISKTKKHGDDIVIVSSGAVGLGCSQLNLDKRPNEVISLQAAASVGQVYLMSLYEQELSKYDYHVGQILLTRSDLESRISYKNAALTFKRLFDWGVVPVVNENDTISDEELKYGDNDTLAALVATAIKADKLILLTDVDKLYSSDPRKYSNAKPIEEVHNQEELSSIKRLSSNKSNWGTGGIITKLDAAKIATCSGIMVQLADGRNTQNLYDLLNGSKCGTIFHPNPKPITNKKSWLAYAIKPIGIIKIDEGACEAILKRGASVLLVGVIEIHGEFSTNQPIKIINPEQKEVARGLCSFGSEKIRELQHIRLNSDKSPVIIHRDVLVLTSNLFD